MVDPAEPPGPRRPNGSSVGVVALSVAVISLLLTGAATMVARSLTDRAATTRRDAAVNEIVGQFEQDVRQHLDLLRAFEGLFEGSTEVTGQELADFSTTTGLDQRHPAVGAVVVLDRDGRVEGYEVPGTDRLAPERLDELWGAPDDPLVGALRDADLADGVATVSLAEAGVIVVASPLGRAGSAAGSPSVDHGWVALAIDPSGLVAVTMSQVDAIEGLALIDRSTSTVVGEAGATAAADAPRARTDTGIGEWDLSIAARSPQTALEERTSLIVLVVGLLATATATSLVAALARSRREALELSDTLRISEETARLVIDRAPIAIVEMVGDRVARANPRAHRLLGSEHLEPGAVPSVEVLDDPTGRPLPLHEAAARPAPEGGRTPLLLHRPVAGGVVEVVAERVDLGRGASLVVVDDVSAREEATRQQIQAQRMEAMGLLAGGVAHDFNNLLSIITGYTELVLRSERLDPLDRASLAEAQRGAERAADVVAELLALTRRTELPSDSMDLNRAITEMSSMIIRVVGAPIEVEFDLDPEPVLVHLDPARLEQVVVNLVLNARDAMPTGGQLGIATRTDGTHAELTLVDSGAGMSEHVRAHLFDPFFTTKANGTGLGLPMVATIVRDAGGEIEVTSEPDAGSTFVLRLPLAEQEAPSGRGDPTPTPEEPVATESTSVLVVEDEPALLKLLVSFLRGAGFAVTSAPDAEAGAEAWHRSGPFDLLVTDVVLPGRSGIDLATELRAGQPELRVLLISGYAKELLPMGDDLPAGAALLRKPFTHDALLDAVARVQRS